ncbi:MAG: 6,7-dimethyl-8-ribityllumazine synthase [Chitinophagaceae bacterium]|nr:6,7-dimethyl-8-ribityllumazine synthase [Chitinophagaceae bacterium]
MASQGQNLNLINTGILPKDACIVIVHTQWNPDVVSRLLDGCVSVLKENGFNNYKIFQVPGCFELAFGIKSIWQNFSQRFEKPQCFIALGCVMRGETPHFDFISKAVTDGILALNLQLPVPTVFGVLTVNNQKQADDRLGGPQGHKGREAALTALKMLEFKYKL